ncbi:MBL fold metallo-hydrolase [Luteimonas vadosa]|uniref:MBL fold metallo-hydrolase n=1 Tax=Luteimonas vadosa TaxID=1165507 RepID=A0ABP9DPP7_9GAMM
MASSPRHAVGRIAGTTILDRVCGGVFALLLACSSQALSQDIRVTLLGTGDPTPSLERFGPGTLVEAAGQTLLFDAGRGTMQRLRQVGVSTGELDGIFLTHLHSDHVVGLVDVWLTGWVVDGRTTPLRVYGPVGTSALAEHLAKAFEYDIAIRTAEAGRSAQGVAIEVTEISGGYRWHADGVEVLAFDVDHAPVAPAFGFRVDSGERSVALSGDTRYSESLIRRAKGVDLLVHEVADAPAAFKQAHPDLPRLVHHTQPADAGRVFTAVAPKLAVYSHLVLAGGMRAEDLVGETRATYDGPLLVGEDLMTLTIADEVTVGTRRSSDQE